MPGTSYPASGRHAAGARRRARRNRCGARWGSQRCFGWAREGRL